MRYSAVLFLLVLWTSAHAGCAQENAQTRKDFSSARLPQESVQRPPAPATNCSNPPEGTSDSDDYNDGYRDGFKAGCSFAASNPADARPQTSGYHLDEATSGTLVPVSYKKENADLLNALQSTCRRAADMAVKNGAGKTEGWNLRYRINLLTGLVQGLVKCSWMGA